MSVPCDGEVERVSAHEPISNLCFGDVLANTISSFEKTGHLCELTIQGTGANHY